jgi:RimJ/RimL family protein N-acetyltransferase
MLTGKHVILTALTKKDLPILFKWINERELVLFNAPFKPISEMEHKAWFDSTQARDDIVIFGIRLIETDRLIGTCQLHSINVIHRSAELQIRIGAEKQRGKGYGAEAANFLLDFAFRDLNLHRVYLYVFASNEAARRMYKKVGFVEEGILRKAAHIDGEFLDVIVMGILRKEYHG